MKKNLPTATVFFIIALILCAVTRFIQYSSVIDYGSGFFISDSGFLGYAFYIALALSCAVIITLIFADKKAKRGLTRRKITRLSDRRALISGIVFAGMGAIFVYRFSAMLIGGGFSTGLIPPALAAIGYLGIGFTFSKFGRLLPAAGILTLSLVAYYTAEAASEFINSVYIANLSGNLIILLVNLALALFYLTGGRVFIRNETGLTGRLTSFYAYSAALLIFSEGLAKLLLLLTSDSETVGYLKLGETAFIPPTVAFFAQGVAVLWLLFVFSSKNKPVSNSKGNLNEIAELNRDNDKSD